jgi:type II secretory pathway pseudopilin PulG
MNRTKKMKNKNIKKSQIWVETVVYTLIGLTIIGILLAIVSPQVEKMRDRNIIMQTIDAIEVMDAKISEVEQSAGSIGVVELKIAKGKFFINGSGNYTLYVLENTRLEFSELNRGIKQGNINITTKKNGNRFNVYLKRDYGSTIDIVVRTGGIDDTDAIRLLQASPTPYKIYIENKKSPGFGLDDKTDIVFSFD